MARDGGRLRSAYGAGALHLLVVVGSLALAAYVGAVLGPGELWDEDVWWQSIVVWFLGAVLLHDLGLFPLYAVADRVVTRLVRRPDGRAEAQPRVPVLNHVRVPALAVGLLLLLFLPGILEQGSGSYVRATGQTQEPFLGRFLLLSASIVATSAIAYGVRVVRRRRAVALPDAGSPE